MTAPPIFLGLDVGSTHTRVLADAEDYRALRIGPGAHLLRDGAHRTSACIVRQIESAIADYLDASRYRDGLRRDDLRLGGICLGVAGADRFEDQHVLRAELRRHLADSSVPTLAEAPLAVEHDATVALEAAFGGESGAIVALDLGTVAYGRTVDGDMVRVGGWGPLLGDEGGSYALGLAALRSVAASMDGGPPSLLAVLLAERHAVLTHADLIAHASREPSRIAALAPLVVEAAEKEDWVATSILKQQANAIAKQIGWLATRAGEGIERRLSLLGTMSQPGYYRECVAEALLRHLPHWRIKRPLAEPVEGALRLARRLAPDARTEQIPTEE